jgi:serine O-acetyltransferase
MEQKTKESIQTVVKSISMNYEKEPLLHSEAGKSLPERPAIIWIIKELQQIIFPGYHSNQEAMGPITEYAVGDSVVHVYEKLKNQIVKALFYKNEGNESYEQIVARAEEISVEFLERIPHIQSMLLKDVEAGFNGDPAAKSREEIIFSYPGLLAIFVYRIAHELYVRNVPFIPRIMTEYAHSRTGIDINSGAVIGEYFFIDHGTGVVIGETTEIGDNVKLYQGVTLGALSTRSGQQLSGVKRHPTLQDNVTIYSGSTILGGETVIGENSVIGGNAFITESVPANTKVSIKNPELKFKGPQK